MLKYSDTSVPDAARILSSKGIEAAFIVPTNTGIDKSIMDATDHVRSYFLEIGFHDYSEQAQGIIEYKKCNVVTDTEVYETKVSLYRPESKNGDPRIWIYGLKKYAEANNLIALVVFKGELYAINCSLYNLEQILNSSDLPLYHFSGSNSVDMAVPNELLQKLKVIYSLGFVDSMRSGATGVGYTLETLLGITANSRKAPDYKGIEIKSTRLEGKKRAGASALNTMFSKKPDWSISPYSAEEILQSFGYKNAEKNRLQLYCSIFASEENTLGFSLDSGVERLSITHKNANKSECGRDVMRWVMEEVRESFSDKHRETFWVGAINKRINGKEEFRYTTVRHTKKPLISTFDRLLETGGIGIDLTMSERSSGKGVRDHGYLFRVKRNSFDELLPLVGTYSLSE